jgi:hypothetical protein
VLCSAGHKEFHYYGHAYSTLYVHKDGYIFFNLADALNSSIKCTDFDIIWSLGPRIEAFCTDLFSGLFPANNVRAAAAAAVACRMAMMLSLRRRSKWSCESRLYMWSGTSPGRTAL